MKQEKLFSKRKVTETILPVIENVCTKNGLIPIEVNLDKESSRWFLRIFLYSHDHQITHKDCENVTRGLDDYLDELIPVKYHMEISSPGAERKFRSPLEFTVFKGKKVKIVLKQPLEEGLDQTIFGHILDYQKNIGLKIKLLETENEVTIDEENIKSTYLSLE